MRLSNLVIRTGDILGHTIAAGLGIDVFINATQGNYQMATVEAIASAGIEITKYLDRRKQRVISEFCGKVPSYVAEFERLSKQIDYE